MSDRLLKILKRKRLWPTVLIVCAAVVVLVRPSLMPAVGELIVQLVSAGVIGAGSLHGWYESKRTESNK